MVSTNKVKLTYKKLDKILHKKIPLIISRLEKVELLVKTLRQDLMESIEDETNSNNK